MSNELRNFLALPYDELEELNLKAKKQRLDRVAPHKVQEERLKYLADEKRIKAVTVLFSDLEGRLHMLDYDKKFLIKSWDNLTFDGSSIRGFTAQRAGMRGIQEWLSFYFKSPMTAPNLYPEHDLFIQLMKLKNTLRWMMGEGLITHLGQEYYD